jgi:hypothetical protein
MNSTKTSKGERALDLITLAPASACSGRSRIFRHAFAARILRHPVLPGQDGSLDGEYQELANSRAAVVAGLPIGRMRPLAAWGRGANTFTAVVPSEGGGVGLLDANVLFTSLNQVRRWLFASRADRPSELLVELQQCCPTVDAIVLIQTGATALVGTGGEKEEASARLPAVPLRPRLLEIAEVASHVLGRLAAPTAGQIRLAVEFALEAAASSGGLANFLVLRQRYAELCARLFGQSRSVGEAA